LKKFKIKTRKRELTKLWSKTVRERDGCCQWCYSRTRQLHAHHVVTKIYGNALRYNLENGMTLCSYCHRDIPNRIDEYIEFRNCWLWDRGIDYWKLYRQAQIKVKFTQTFFEHKKAKLLEALKKAEDIDL